MTAATSLTRDEVEKCLLRILDLTTPAAEWGSAIDLAAVREHVDELHRENASLRVDVANLRDTLGAVTGGWQPSEAVELTVVFTAGRVEVCTDRSVPVLVSAAYPIVEG